MEQKTQMYALVEQWKKSDLTFREFASKNGVFTETLRYWKRKMNAELNEASTETQSGSNVSFIEIKQEPFISKPSPKAIVELLLPSGLCPKTY